MIAPGLPEIARSFGITNSTVAALTLSVFILAYVRGLPSVHISKPYIASVYQAIGPLFITPLSEGNILPLGSVPRSHNCAL
jgi:hypothetical protein